MNAAHLLAYALDDPGDCAACGMVGGLQLLGTLGTVEHYRCRFCGALTHDGNRHCAEED